MAWKKKADIRGPRGAKGRSVTTAVVGQDGQLVVAMDDGTAVRAGNVVGPRGLPGVNGVENDAAVAGYLVADGSATRQALLSQPVVSDLSSRLLVSPAPYRRWHAALANRFYAPAKWLRLGHSFTEGTGATAFGNRWIDRARDLLRDRFPVPGAPGGVGYIPPYFVTPTIPDPPRSGGVELINFGPGGRCLYLDPGIEVAFENIVGTSVDLMFVSGASTGSITWRLDDGANASIATADPAAGIGRDGNFARVPVTAGTHRLTVGASGGGIYLTGIIVHRNDENAGIQVFDAAHHGWKAADFINSLTVAASGGDLRALWNLKPDLVTIEMAVNEWTTSVPSTEFEARLRDLIWYVKNSASPSPSVALVVDYQDLGAYAQEWSDFVEVYKRVGADYDCAVIDLDRRFLPAQEDLYGLMVGDGHPSDKGHSAMADAIVAAISPQQ